jgi:protein-disulfide isomerase
MTWRPALALVAVALFAQKPAVDWHTAAELPGIHLEKLTPEQRKAALEVLRDFSCPCGCTMKLAQCRVEDPACGQSKAVSEQVVEEAAANKTTAEIRKALESSPYVKAAADRTRILLDPVEISLAGAPAKGPANARITLVEFSDFQCPYCVRAVVHLNAIMKAMPNDVRLVYKQYPLDTHSQAALASRASIAAHAQGKFWPMHDKLYANAKLINRDNILLWAKGLGLDMSKFTDAMDSAAVKMLVDREIEEGDRVGVNGTPTVFVNGKKYQGALDPGAFLPILEKELKGQ